MQDFPTGNMLEIQLGKDSQLDWQGHPFKISANRLVMASIPDIDYAQNLPM